MPQYVRSPLYDESGLAETAMGALSGLFAITMIPGVGDALMRSAWSIGKGTATGAYDTAKLAGRIAKNVYRTATVHTPTFTRWGIAGGRAIGGFGVGATIGAAQAAKDVGWGFTKMAVSGALGTAKTGYNAFMWGGRHPFVGAAAAGAIGIGVGAVATSEGPAGAQFESSGVSDLMRGMNASGDVVLGMHRRR